jgi:hemolysin activation/secretion protein
MNAAAWAQNVPAPSQVAPPQIVPPPSTARIAIPQVPAGAAIPAEAKRLSFRLTGVHIKGEFPELAGERKALSDPLVGRRVTVADIFEFADKIQQIYVRAGYPLVRIVIQPQEIEGSARIELRVIDGFVERLDLDALDARLRDYVAAVLAPLVGQTHLKQAELERRLLIAGDAAGLTLNATFAAGKKEGGSALILTGRYKPVSVSVYTDNAMPRVFGNYQLVTAVSANSVLGFGEQITVSAAGLPNDSFPNTDPVRRYLSGRAIFPIGIDGLKFEVGVTNGVTTPRVDRSTATQGLLNQAYARLSYDVIKSRDGELTAFGRFDATNEELDTLLFAPPLPLSLDRVRALRGGLEGVWRLRDTGTTVNFDTTFSRGLDAFGARSAADATFLLPLSRQGADAEFYKWSGRVEITQALPEGFAATAILAGQTSFNKPLLNSEQYVIDGSRFLSGFTAGSLAGDTAWVARAELGRAVAVPFEAVGVTLTPYLFGATGERKYVAPTFLEIGNLQATNYGAGLRVNLAPSNTSMPSGYGFVEWSRRTSNDHSRDGDRVFTGLALQY